MTTPWVTDLNPGNWPNGNLGWMGTIQTTIDKIGLNNAFQQSSITCRPKVIIEFGNNRFNDGDQTTTASSTKVINYGINGTPDPNNPGQFIFDTAPIINPNIPFFTPDEAFNNNNRNAMQWAVCDVGAYCDSGYRAVDIYDTANLLDTSVELVTVYEHGWWSNNKSDGSGNFGAPEWVSSIFNKPRHINQVDLWLTEGYTMMKHVVVQWQDLSGAWNTVFQGDLSANTYHYAFPLGDQLRDPSTGRLAFTGPRGEGGTASDPHISGFISWAMPDGRVAWYSPGKNIQSGNIMALKAYNANLSKTVICQGLKIFIYSTYQANDFARVSELQGLLIADVSDDVVTFDCNQQRENFDGVTPTASVKSGTLSLVLDNTQATYSPDNQFGPFYGYLLHDDKITLSMGVKTFRGTWEYFPMGIFYSDEWDSDSGQGTATVTCRDFSKYFQDQAPHFSKYYVNQTAKDAVNDLVCRAGKTINEQFVDVNAGRIFGVLYINNETFWNWMSQVAFADLGTFNFDPLGNFIYISNSETNPMQHSVYNFSDTTNIISAQQKTQIYLDSVIVNISNINLYDSARQSVWTPPKDTGDSVGLSFNNLKYGTDSTQQTISVTGNMDSVQQAWPQDGWLRIDKELISYTNRDSYNFFNCTRGVGGTIPAGHSVSDYIGEAIYYQDLEYSTIPVFFINPPDLYLPKQAIVSFPADEQNAMGTIKNFIDVIIAFDQNNNNADQANTLLGYESNNDWFDMAQVCQFITAAAGDTKDSQQFAQWAGNFAPGGKWFDSTQPIVNPNIPPNTGALDGSGQLPPSDIPSVPIIAPILGDPGWPYLDAIDGMKLIGLPTQATIDIWNSNGFTANLSISNTVPWPTFLVATGAQPFGNKSLVLDWGSVIAGVVPIVNANRTKLKRAPFANQFNQRLVRKHGKSQVTVTNQWIQNKSHGQQIADFLIAQYNTPRPILSMVAIGNPLLQLGDRVTITQLKELGIYNIDYEIISMDHSYDGGLQTTFTLRQCLNQTTQSGVVNPL